MAYLSLYRKYRSQSFDEVSGQDHVTRTLQNAVRTGRVAHAYLLCGPRGTGKTTTARLLAKAMNCEQGPTAEPCNRCSACTQITVGSFLDLKEIDAASNRSIDDVRDLRDNVSFTPAEGRFKVYIIDEVHQLTNEAFNALLKTLEEPPPHVLFILATTDQHKLPATIVSRCQKFEFRRATMQQLRERVAWVAEQEGATLDDAALDLIAAEANGGWRDALSILEQILAFCEGHVTAADVYNVLGTVEADTLLALADHALAGDGGGVFRTLDELIAEGKDPRQLIKDLTSHYRSLMLSAAGSSVPGEASWAERIREQSARYGQARLIEAIEVLAQTEREARWSEQPRLLLELAVVRLMHPRGASQPAAVGAAAPARAAAPPRSAPSAPPRPAPAARSPEPPAREVERSPFVDEAPARPAPANGNGIAREEPPARPAFTEREELPPPPLTVGDARQGGGEDEDVDLDALFSTPSAPHSTPTTPAPRPVEPAQPAPTPPVAPAVPEEAAPIPSGSTAAFDVNAVRAKWRLIGEELKRDKKVMIQAFLADTQPDRFEGDTLVIAFPSKTMADGFTQRGKSFSDPLVAAIEKLTGIRCRVRSESGGGKGAPARPKPADAGQPSLLGGSPEPAPSEAPAPAASKPSGPPIRPQPPSGGESGEKLVHNVLEVFDGRIVEPHEE